MEKINELIIIWFVLLFCFIVSRNKAVFSGLITVIGICILLLSIRSNWKLGILLCSWDTIVWIWIFLQSLSVALKDWNDY